MVVGLGALQDEGVAAKDNPGPDNERGSERRVIFACCLLSHGFDSRERPMGGGGGGHNRPLLGEEQ